MITIAVQGQQASQMVEVQGAPQPAEGSGDTFRETFAATVGSVPSGKTPAEGAAQSGASALRSTFGNNVASGNGLLGKSLAFAGSATVLSSLTATKTTTLNSGEAASETLSAPTAPASGTVADSSENDAAASLAAEASGTLVLSPEQTSAAALLKNSLPAPVDTVAGVPGTSLRNGSATSGPAANTARTSQADRKTEVPSSKAASTAPQTSISPASVPAAVLAPVPSASVAPQSAVPVQVDLGGNGQAFEPKGSDAVQTARGIGSSSGPGTGPASGAGWSAAASQMALPQSAGATPIATDNNFPLPNSAAIVSAAKTASGPDPTSGAAQQVGTGLEAGVGAVSRSSGAAAEPAQFAASIKGLTPSSPVNSTSAPVSGTVLKPGELQNLQTAFTTQTASVAASNAAARANTTARPVPSTRNGATAANASALRIREQASTAAAADTNPLQTGAGLAQSVAAVQTPNASQIAVQAADTSRKSIAAGASVAKDAKTRLGTDTASATGSSGAVSGKGADSTAVGAAGSGLTGSDANTAQKDAAASAPGSVVPAVALPIAHNAPVPVAPVAGGGSGAAVPAVSTGAVGASTRSVGALSGASAGGPSVAASTGATDTGFVTDGAASHRTLLATPTTLEVGVPNGTQGWLRIRAEVGGQGEVNASLAAGSSGAQEALHSQLPALNAYLHSERMPVTATVADRTFSFAGGHAGTGNQPGGSGDANGSGSSFFQGGAPQSDAGQQPPRQGTVGSDATRGYGGLSGANELSVAAAVLQPGSGAAVSEESGQWLNVRV